MTKVEIVFSIFAVAAIVTMFTVLVTQGFTHTEFIPFFESLASVKGVV